MIYNNWAKDKGNTKAIQMVYMLEKPLQIMQGFFYPLKIKYFIEEYQF